MRRITSAAAVLGTLISWTAAADPLSVSTTGFLLDSNDRPVTGQGIGLQFSLWDSPSGIAPSGKVWPPAGESDCSVSIIGGYYSATLDGARTSGCGAGLDSSHFPGGAARYLQVSIGGIPLLPRAALGAVPLAMHAETSADTQQLIAQLSQGGSSVNAATNRVDWKSLKGVPPGLADGVDNDTTYTAGAGLVLNGNAFELAATSVGSASLIDGAVTGAKIGVSAVGSIQLADGSVSTAKLADSAVTSAKLADSAVTTAKLADAAVGGLKLADGSVSTGKLADGSVSSAKVADGSISTSKLADGSVTGAKIAAGTITADRFAANALDGAKPAANSVTAAQLSSESASLAKVSGGVVLMNGANVGIGTSTAAADLHVRNGVVRVGHTGSDYSELRGGSGVGAALVLNYADGASNVTLRGNGHSVLNLSQGSVGIGTASPTAKLHVQGDAKVTGRIDGRFSDEFELRNVLAGACIAGVNGNGGSFLTTTTAAGSTCSQACSAAHGSSGCAWGVTFWGGGGYYGYQYECSSGVNYQQGSSGYYCCCRQGASGTGVFR